MHIEEFHAYCLAKPGTEETFPFDEHTLVFKVMGKMYAITGLNHIPFRVNLKCDPEYALELREQHPGQIIPGWHMNKQHWNTVYFEDGLSDALLCSLIDHSYDLIVESLPASKREALKFLTSND
ncbi:MAG: MmcQ/YjbR family DNA-binding protein [Saprospiraceae bacterium]|nr:MmcQ/YjbR family DNA-binding protein [Saprospiraceae bacterium]